MRLLNTVDGATLRDLGINDIESQVYGEPEAACAGTTATGGAAQRSADRRAPSIGIHFVEELREYLREWDQLLRSRALRPGCYAH